MEQAYVVYLNDQDESYIELSELHDVGDCWVVGTDDVGRTVYIPTINILYLQEDK